MKIAYLITAYSNFAHLEKLLKSLDDIDSGFFIHFDKKSDIPKYILDNKKLVLVKRVKVWWGGWSHQQAIINLMNEATNKGYEYYVFCSGADYPIRPNTFLYNKLKEGGEYLNIIKGFQIHKPEARIKFYYFDCFDRRNRNSKKTIFFLFIEQFLRKLIIKHHYPFKEIYHGSTWWALSDKCVVFIMNFIKNNPEYVNFYKTCWAPDESFIPTIIGNSEYLKDCKGNLTYADWSVNPGPAFITNNHYLQFKYKTEFKSSYGYYSPFFARKFNDESKYLIELINKELRTEL